MVWMDLYIPPVATISYGISLAQSQGKIHVLVAGGTYEENIDIPDGLIFYGSMSESS